MNDIKKEKAIILCGGLGTRLRETIGDKQKTMAEVKGVPFLHHIVDYLKSEGINTIIFACGYKADDIVKYFGDGKKFGITALYSAEFSPLGTGGAIRNSLKFLNSDDERVFVLNGDTEFKVNLNSLIDNMEEYKTSITIALKETDDHSRYGSIELEEDKESSIVKSFDEKKKTDDENNKAKYINGGVYLIKKSLINEVEKDKQISIEKELFPEWIKRKVVIGGVVCSESFIDIGTKESYESVK